MRGSSLGKKKWPRTTLEVKRPPVEAGNRWFQANIARHPQKWWVSSTRANLCLNPGLEEKIGFRLGESICAMQII
jgi:hypothetical protein